MPAKPIKVYPERLSVVQQKKLCAWHNNLARSRSPSIGITISEAERPYYCRHGCVFRLTSQLLSSTHTFWTFDHWLESMSPKLPTDLFSIAYDEFLKTPRLSAMRSQRLLNYLSHRINHLNK